MVAGIPRNPQEPGRRREVRVDVRQIITVFAWSVGLVFFFYFLGAFKLVLLGFLAALCVACLLRPLLKWLPGPRGLTGFLLGLVPLLVCAGLLFACGWFLVKPIAKEFHYWPQTEAHFNAWLGQLSGRLRLAQPLTVGALIRTVGTYFSGSGMMQGVAGDLIDLAIGVVFVFVGTIYMLAEPAEQAIPPLLALLPERRRLQGRAMVDALEPRLRWWLIGALITASAIGLTSLLGFWLIGLNFFIPLGILAGISEFIPTIGPLMAFLLALAFAAAQGGDKVMWLGGLYVAVHILESYILIPLVYREAVRVPPVITLFTVVLWGKIFGIGGLLLALPINLVLWTMAEKFIGDQKAVVTSEEAGVIRREDERREAETRRG